jgi:hypothetical protein
MFEKIYIKNKTGTTHQLMLEGSNNESLWNVVNRKDSYINRLTYSVTAD